jgi:hypothetical protein
VQQQVQSILVEQQKVALQQQQMDDAGLDVRRNDALLETAVDMAMQEYPRWAKKE